MLCVSGAEGNEKHRSCNGVYRKTSDTLWSKVGGESIIYRNGSKWKINYCSSQGGWFYSASGSDVISCTWEPAAGAEGSVAVRYAVPFKSGRLRCYIFLNHFFRDGHVLYGATSLHTSIGLATNAYKNAAAR